MIEHSHTDEIVCRSRCRFPQKGDRLMHRHRKERVFIGPKSAEIVVNLRRPHGAGFYEDADVTLRIRRHRCGEQPVAELKPYAVDKTSFLFPIEGEFFTDVAKFPKGFYIGEIVIENCVTDTIEIVKSPGVYAAQALTTRDACFQRKVFVDSFCPTTDCVEKEQEQEEAKTEEGRKLCKPKVIVETRLDNETCLPDISELMENVDE